LGYAPFQELLELVVVILLPIVKSVFRKCIMACDFRPDWIVLEELFSTRLIDIS
jgi:hypothetical protein